MSQKCKGLFIWRRPGPVRRAGSPRWDDFCPTFIWNLLSQFNQKVCYVAGKRLFDEVVFTITNDVKSSCRTNVLVLFNLQLKNKTKLQPYHRTNLENYTSKNTRQQNTTQVQDETTRHNTSTTRHSTTQHEYNTR